MVVASRGLQTRFYSSTIHENDPVTLENEKARNLQGKQHNTHPEDAPGWNEALASESEAVIKAQRSSDAGHADPKEMVEKTIQSVMKKHHGEKVPIVQIRSETEQLLTHDNGEISEAKYEKDEVVGPLKEAVSKVADVLTGANGKKK